MKLRNVLLFLFVLAVSILQGCHRENFPVENMRDITHEQWEQITVGMTPTNVVSILGPPSFIIPDNLIPDNSESKEVYFYSPKTEIFLSETKTLVVSDFIVELISNKVTNTFVAYESPEQRKWKMHRR